MKQAGKNPAFKKIFDSWKRFRNDEFQWFRIAEATYANFVYNNAK